MLPQGEVFTATDTVPFLLNTVDPTTGEAAAWASGAIRLMRLRGDPAVTTNWTEVTDDVGYALDLDWDPSASPRTGLHVGSVDMDGLTAAAQSGDLYVVVGSAGTVGTENMINLALCWWWILSDGMTQAQKDDANAAADTAITDRFGAKISSSVNDASATATSFTTTADQSSVVLYGIVELTSGALDGESRVAKWTGTTLTVLGDDDMDAAEKQFSAAPANSVTFDFFPVRS